MQALIDVFRMEELTPKTRANIIIKLGKAINDQYGMNITKELVYELVKQLDPDNKEIISKTETSKDLIKSDWDIRRCFEQLLIDQDEHFCGDGVLFLTFEQQQEICKMVDQFYIRK